MSSMIALPSIYKYTDTYSARQILRNSTIKLSSPAAFNDPFDTHLGAALPLDTKEFLKSLMPAFVEFSMGEIDYSSLRPGPMAEKIIRVNQALKTASANQIGALRNEIINTPVESVWDISKLEEINRETVAKLRVNFQNSGIFCASIKKDNLLMWSHYADQHKGVVLEISPSREKDSTLLLSRPITYAVERPSIYRTARQMIEHTYTMLAEDSVRIILDRLIYTKSIDWSYEAEWRMHIPSFVPPGKTSEFLRLHKEEITAIYFGCRCAAAEREMIARVAIEANENIKLNQMKMAAREYALEWDLLPR